MGMGPLGAAGWGSRLDVHSFLTYLQYVPWYKGQLVHRESIPPRAAEYGELDAPLHPRLAEALAEHGIDELYTHQAEAINHIRRGENVIVATPAASGKSLCYQVPVVEALVEDRSACALYIFPTKALSQDQSESLESLTTRLGGARHAVYDGDTPRQDRGAIRRSSRVVITNPDMLHVGILPNHRAWYRLLRNLRYVVIDEAHVFRGVFGSHFANVLRRLRRLCRQFGSDPQFVMCSATVANPAEHAQRLTGLPFRVVNRDGSSSGGKDFLFWNPPLLDYAEGSRLSTNTETARIFAELLRRRVRTLAFVKSRQLAELVYLYARRQLEETDPAIVDRVSPYRGGYMPEERRRIERELYNGRLLGLATTNALELGINVGDLDATLLNGYPGSIASAWQQAARSGRSGDRSLSVLVALDDPLDQYLMRHPEAFFGRSHERALTSPENEYILKPHLLCAAYEAPLTMADTEFFGPDLLMCAAELQEDGLLNAVEGRWHLSPETYYPAESVNIRSASTKTYTLVDDPTGLILETLDELGALLQLHPGGIYLHQGEQYLVKALDLESRTAYASREDAPYYTQARDLTDTRVLRVFKWKRAGNTRVYLGEVRVSTTVVGFLRRAHMTGELLGSEDVDLPSQSYDTVALWFDVPECTLETIRLGRMHLAGGLHAVEHAAIGVLPLFAMCDRNDIGGITTPLHPDTGRPQVFIHDAHPGGVGIAELGYELIEQLWATTLQAVSECGCESGCPGCIQSPKCGSNNQPLDKAVAELILRDITAPAGGPRP